jgi:hypothetical protein
VLKPVGLEPPMPAVRRMQIALWYTAAVNRSHHRT